MSWNTRTGAVLAALLAAGCHSGLAYRGVNLAGAEFGVNTDGTGALPGTPGVDYVYPDPTYASGYASAAYFVSKGMNAFRLPFRWERLQPERGRALNNAELERLTSTVRHLTAQGASVILDPHNYARYGSALVGSAVPSADFADFWARVAAVFKDEPEVLFGLVNEPHDMPTEQWLGAANAAIAAIRGAGASNLILVPGNGWTGAHDWSGSSYGTANAALMLRVSDPLHRYAYEVHQYLDADSSGRSSECVSATIGSERLRGFTSWLRAHHQRGFLAEFGGGPNARCEAALDDLLGHLEQNEDVWLGWTYWAAGPWWGDYFLSLEPKGGRDAPQLLPLAKHL